MAIDQTQRGVLLSMLIALALSILALVTAYHQAPSGWLPEEQTAARIAAALHWSVLPLLTLLACIGNLARHRFFTPADISGSGFDGGTERARLLQGALQNTLEQTLAAVLVYLAWAAVMPAERQGVIPVAALAFFIGRLAFFAGYAKGAPARALGFALTFYPSVLLALTLALTLLWRLLT